MFSLKRKVKQSKSMFFVGLTKLSPKLYRLCVRAKLKKLYSKAGVSHIHIPKSAGSSINQALYGTGVEHFTYVELMTFLREEEVPNPFVVIREPWSRLYSSYRYAINSGTDTGIVYKPKQYNNFKNKSFEYFILNFLNDDLESLDRIFWPQSWFVDAGDNPKPLIFSLDSLSALETHLSEKLGQSIKIPKLNLGKSNNFKNDFDELSDKAKLKVERLYSSDFYLWKKIKSSSKKS